MASVVFSLTSRDSCLGEACGTGQLADPKILDILTAWESG